MGVHPILVSKVGELIRQMAEIGHPVRVAQGLRTQLQQAALYAKGRTEKGPKVTNCDGYVKKSNHQSKADGYGHAVDLCFVSPEPFAEEHPWAEMGARAKALGLEWGGDWTSFPDRPHVELPALGGETLVA